MCKFIGKSNERILCKLSKIEILRLYSSVHVAMEMTKMSHFTCHSKFFISKFFTCQVSACELQASSCHDLANDVYSQTAKTVFSHLNAVLTWLVNVTGHLSVKPWCNWLSMSLVHSDLSFATVKSSFIVSQIVGCSFICCQFWLSLSKVINFVQAGICLLLFSSVCSELAN